MRDGSRDWMLFISPVWHLKSETACGLERRISDLIRVEYIYGGLQAGSCAVPSFGFYIFWPHVQAEDMLIFRFTFPWSTLACDARLAHHCFCYQ